jgi:hypothetical protein
VFFVERRLELLIVLLLIEGSPVTLRLQGTDLFGEQFKKLCITNPVESEWTSGGRLASDFGTNKPHNLRNHCYSSLRRDGVS